MCSSDLTRDRGRLPVQCKSLTVDRLWQPYVLMIGACGVHEARGWCFGIEVELLGTVEQYHHNPPSYFVQQAYLHGMERLVLLLARRRSCSATTHKGGVT